MKRCIISLVIALLVLYITLTFAGCGTQNGNEITAPLNTAPTVTTSPIETTRPSKQETGIYGDTIILGNIQFTIPDGFTASKINERTFLLSSEDNECFFGLFAIDISDKSESTLKTYLPQQQKSFRDTEGTIIDEDKIDGFISGFDVMLNFYSEINLDLEITAKMDTTFTDSWYAYTVLFQCDGASEKLSDYVTTFAHFTGYSKYIGEEPRFNFVQ